MNTSTHLSAHQISKPPLLKTTHKCSESCEWCQKPFAVFDNPNHISRIRNIEKQTAFLKFDSFLKTDTCLCDRCWKYLDKTYKLNHTEKTEDISIPSVSNDVTGVEVDRGIIIESPKKKSVNPTKRNKHSRRNRKRKRQSDTCSVHKCSHYSIYPIPIDECIQLKQIFSKFDFSSMVLIESNKIKFKHIVPSTLSVCEEHLHLVDVVTTCQLCGNKLNENLDSELWKMYDKWNCTLSRNNIPLILKPGMFICMTCKNCIFDNDSLSDINLENIRQHVEKRYDARIKLFGPAIDSFSKICQESDVDHPIVIAKMFNSENSAKVKFTDPLVTETHYFESDNNDYCSDKEEKEKLDYSDCDFGLLIDPEVNSNKSIEITTSETVKFSDLSNVKDNLPQTAEEYPKYDCRTNHCSVIPETVDEELDNKETFESVLGNKEENAQTLLTKRNVYDPFSPRRIPGRIRNMVELVRNSFDVRSNNKLSLLPEHNEVNSPACSTKNTAYKILNSTFNNFTTDPFATNRNVITASMDVEKDLLPLHVLNLLDNDEDDMSKNVELDKNKPVISGVCLDQKEESSRIKDVETSKNNPVVTSVYTDHRESKVEVVETNKNKSVDTSVYSEKSMCHVNQKKSSVDLYENNQNIDVSSVKTANLNESDQSLCSSISFVEPLQKKADPVEIRKKLRNVVCRRISSECMKKQRLNKTPQLNSVSLHENENKTDISVGDSNAKSFNDKNIIYQNPNSPVILNTFSQCKNENILNNNNYSSDVQYVSSNDEDEESSMQKDDNLMNYAYTEEPNTNEPSIQIERTYSLDPNWSGPLRFQRTLKKISEFSNNKKMSSGKREINSDDTVVSDKEVLSDDSLEPEPHDNSTSNFQPKLNRVQFISNPKSKAEPLLVKSRNIEFPQLTNNETDEIQYVSNQSHEQDNTEELCFQLNNSNSHVYESLKARFNDSELLLYLMENQRMLFNSELVLSENAGSHVTTYVKKHLSLLRNWYGDPEEDCNASSSFLHSSSYIRQYSRRLSPDRELPVVTRGIISNTLSYSHSVSTPKEIVTSASQTSSSLLTTSTYTMSKPIASRQVFNFSSSARQTSAPATSAKSNDQLPVAVRFPSVSQPASYRSGVQPSFQLPTAVRSGGISFMQPNSQSPSHNNLNRHCVVKNAFNNFVMAKKTTPEGM